MFGKKKEFTTKITKKQFDAYETVRVNPNINVMDYEKASKASGGILTKEVVTEILANHSAIKNKLDADDKKS